MILVKKKIIQIFSDGSLNFNYSIIKKSKKLKLESTDHTTFSFNKKNTSSITDLKDFKNFKTKYLKV